MTDEAKKARAAYMKEWRKRNPEKHKATVDRFWQRKAEQAKQESK